MCAPAAPTVDSLHLKFLALLPKIELHLRIYFRDIACEHRKEDCVAEALALCWRWFITLARRGKDATGFPSVLAAYAARAVRCGRRVCGQEPAKDVLSPRAQRRHEFTVSRLPDVSTLESNAWDEALIDNTRSEVPDQVAFRLDFPRWRLSRSERDRRVVDDLMVGERTQAVARKYGLTPSRISQLRRAFAEDWSRFCDDGADDEQALAETERRL